MTNPDGEYDPMVEWRAERKARRIEMFTARIPKVHRNPGELHPDVSGWVKAMTDGTRPNLAMTGGTGSGKTWHAWHAAFTALQAGWDGRIDFVSADEFRAHTAPQPDGGHYRAMERMGSADLLVVDDVGAHRATDWWLESLYAVVNRRYDGMLPTVLTSNVADLRAELGERIASRLSQDLVFVVLDGPDRRRA